MITLFMQGDFYLSFSEKHNKQIEMLNLFLDRNDNLGALIVAERAENIANINQILVENDVFILNQEVFENSINRDDPLEMLYDILDEYDGDAIAVDNIDAILSVGSKQRSAIFLKQFIDEVQSSGLKIILITVNEEKTNILNDFASRVRSFNKIVFC